MSATSDLQVFLREKASMADQGPPEPVIDWESKKNQWLREVAKLYELVKGWLGPLERDGVLEFATESVTLAEDYIGTYETEALMIHVAKQKVAFYPKGTLIVGAEGRIDIEGPAGVRTIVLEDGHWSVVARTPRLRVLPFNEDSFQDILREVME